MGRKTGVRSIDTTDVPRKVFEIDLYGCRELRSQVSLSNTCNPLNSIMMNVENPDHFTSSSLFSSQCTQKNLNSFCIDICESNSKGWCGWIMVFSGPHLGISQMEPVKDGKRRYYLYQCTVTLANHWIFSELFWVGWWRAMQVAWSCIEIYNK